MHCPGRNATDPIWRVLASSLGISSWTPLKPQHSNPNPNPLANQLWSIDFLTPATPLIVPHRLPVLLESVMPHKNWCMQDGAKAVWSIPYVSVAFFPSLKQNFIAYRSSKVSSRTDCIFEIHLLWQSGFSKVYSNCSCSCSFELEILKIGQSSQKMYSQESTTILNARCYDPPPPESLVFDFFFSIPHPHILFLLGEGEDGESWSVPSRSEDGENRKLGTSMKTNCNKVCVSTNQSRLDYLLRSLPTKRERFVTSEKGKIVVGTFFLPYLSFSWFPRVFGDFCPSSVDVELLLFWFSLGWLCPMRRVCQCWSGMIYELIRFVAVCWVCCSFHWCSRRSDDP